MQDGRSADVVVVGAGFAGLAAAHELAGAGARVAVAEARDRVGGRALTRLLPDGTQLDLGGQWVGPSQHEMRELIERHGMRTYPTPEHGRAVVDYEGALVDAMPAEVTALYSELDRLSREIPADAPWTHPRARCWDGRTLASWLAERTSDPAVARTVARQTAGALLSLDAADASLLEILFYLVSGDGLDVLAGFAGGAQSDRLVGGPQELAGRMAAALPAGTIHHGAPVRRIEHGTGGAVVRAGALRLEAARVIVAIPPLLAGRIEYDPPLPPRRDGLTQRMAAGYALKTHAVYREPFWRARGLSGISFSSAGVLTETVDNTPPGGPSAVLTSFVYGADAHRLRSRTPGDRRRAVLERLAELFGGEARDPVDYVEFDWCAEPWTRGCFSGHLAPGAWTGFGPALRAPVGVLHWAGTETATRWNGYFDGAVQSGRRAAAEVLAAGSAAPPGSG
ncbi:flavin monoamine oxidase family protein [Actinomadura violacea]|uniref:FAD-dependent oxidoreductase n=1 Tax=Actinomadura violacea TaxID=2819934 RepID=A0ABS3RNT4_9ACTN|nr:FAD-dependent oxidoreductase [Actinomadura violacea]MBO2458404.1 FAD-dependent oxidoreductase [Actinomadura violacea]